MAWPQDAYVGQKVVRYRTDDEFEDIAPPLNKEVTISWIGIAEWYGQSIIVIDTVEYPSPRTSSYKGWQRGWAAAFFRPVQSTSTGFALLTALLNPANHRHREDA